MQWRQMTDVMDQIVKLNNEKRKNEKTKNEANKDTARDSDKSRGERER